MIDVGSGIWLENRYALNSISKNFTDDGSGLVIDSVTVGSGVTEISIDGDTDTLNMGTDTTALLGGYVIMDALPTADPTTLGQLWNSNGTVKVSAGA